MSGSAGRGPHGPDHDGHDDGRGSTRPLPRRLEAMAPGHRVILAVVGILVGAALVFAGLKLLSDDVTGTDPVPQQQDGG